MGGRLNPGLTQCSLSIAMERGCKEGLAIGMKHISRAGRHLKTAQWMKPATFTSHPGGK